MGASKSPRAAARRQLLAELRDIKSIIARSIDRWVSESGATVWEWDAPREPGANIPKRPREAREYPEMMSREWRLIAMRCELAASRLTELAINARHMADVTRDPRT